MADQIPQDDWAPVPGTLEDADSIEIAYLQAGVDEWASSFGSAATRHGSRVRVLGFVGPDSGERVEALEREADPATCRVGVTGAPYYSFSYKSGIFKMEGDQLMMNVAPVKLAVKELTAELASHLCSAVECSNLSPWPLQALC